jgi:hypothetical protein
LALHLAGRLGVPRLTKTVNLADLVATVRELRLTGGRVIDVRERL